MGRLLGIDQQTWDFSLDFTGGSNGTLISSQSDFMGFNRM